MVIDVQAKNVVRLRRLYQRLPKKYQREVESVIQICPTLSQFSIWIKIPLRYINALFTVFVAFKINIQSSLDVLLEIRFLMSIGSIAFCVLYISCIKNRYNSKFHTDNNHSKLYGSDNHFILIIISMKEFLSWESPFLFKTVCMIMITQTELTS